MEQHIPKEPVFYMVVGLVLVALLVLILPFKVKKIEENLEPFFLVMGIIAVSISGLWSWNLVLESLKAPVMIGSIPVGIFQVVLVFGLILYYFNKPFCSAIIAFAAKVGPKIFIFLLVLILGLISSLISVIVTAVILSEVIAALPVSKEQQVKIAVVSCFAVGLGAALTPIGEPLSTILVQKLSGPPYYADFMFPVRTFGAYIIPGIVIIALFGAFYIGRGMDLKNGACETDYKESLRTVIIRAVKVFLFVAALILLGDGLKPLIIWYFTSIPSWVLYWINIISAILDNATLTAIEIGPSMGLGQIISIIMGLCIAGGMLIPGNIPNIVAAGRLRISMKEWAVIGIPIGMVIMIVYFIVLLPHF